MYKEASRLKLRIATPQGELGVEQLWGLTIPQLDTLAVSLEEDYKASGKKTFLDKRAAKDQVAKLKFDLVFDILNTKVEEAEAAQIAKENKEHNEKILTKIAEKKDAALNDMSISQLMKQLK